MEMNLNLACFTLRTYAQARGDQNDPSLTSFSKIGVMINEKKWSELFKEKLWVDCIKIAVENELFMTDMAVQVIGKNFPEEINKIINSEYLVGNLVTKFEKISNSIEKNGYSDDSSNHGPRIGYINPIKKRFNRDISLE